MLQACGGTIRENAAGGAGSASSDAGEGGQSGSTSSAAGASGEADDGLGGEADIGSAGAPFVEDQTGCPTQHGIGTLTKLPSGHTVCDCPPGTWGARCEITTRQVVVNGPGCALKSDGTVSCWGSIGRFKFPPDVEFQKIAGDDIGDCGLTIDGAVLCWEENEVTTHPGPFTDLSISSSYRCGLGVDQRITCWTNSPVEGAAVPVLPTDIQYSAVAATSQSVCGLSVTGETHCWTQPNATPAGVTGTFLGLFGGYYSMCGLTAEHTLECSHALPAPPKGEFVKAAIGSDYACALDAAQHVVCWGNDDRGQASPPDGEFVDVAVGRKQSCAVRADGTVSCWGLRGSEFQLNPPSGVFTSFESNYGSVCGLMANGSPYFPDVALAGPKKPPFADVACNSAYNCVLTTDRKMACWDQYRTWEFKGSFQAVRAGGEVACGIDLDSHVQCQHLEPTDDLSVGVTTLPTETFTDLALTGGEACAIKTDGSLYCWYLNCGVNDVPACPGKIYSPAGKFKQVINNPAFCGLQTNGLIRCWDYTGNAMLLSSTSRMVRISGGGANICGLTEQGNIECATRFENEFGGADPKQGPFIDLAVLEKTTCGLRPNGRAECWGQIVRPPQ